MLKPSQYLANINLLTLDSLMAFKIVGLQDFDWLNHDPKNDYYDRSR